jgi:hypothetical protein
MPQESHLVAVVGVYLFFIATYGLAFWKSPGRIPKNKDLGKFIDLLQKHENHVICLKCKVD